MLLLRGADNHGKYSDVEVINICNAMRNAMRSHITRANKHEIPNLKGFNNILLAIARSQRSDDMKRRDYFYLIFYVLNRVTQDKTILSTLSTLYKNNKELDVNYAEELKDHEKLVQYCSTRDELRALVKIFKTLNDYKSDRLPTSSSFFCKNLK